MTTSPVTTLVSTLTQPDGKRISLYRMGMESLKNIRHICPIDGETPPEALGKLAALFNVDLDDIIKLPRRE